MVALRKPDGRLLNGSFNGTALERFRRNCRHDPGTDCVLWTGGTTSGRGHSAPYGSFWFEGRRWFAHRWAAKYIHGLEIDGLQVDHCCPNIPYPNTLCVNHVQPKTLLENRALQTERGRALKVVQSTEERKAFIHMQVGLIEPPPLFTEAFTEAPWYPVPAWLASNEALADDCPF